MEKISQILLEHYGLELDAVKALQGYEDKTYLIKSGRQAWIVKEHTSTREMRYRISFESDFMRHMDRIKDYAFPIPIQTCSGYDYVEFNDKLYRVLRYLNGTFLGELEPNIWPATELGNLLGRLALHSKSFEGMCQDLNPSPWDLQHLCLHKATLDENYLSSKLESRIRYFIQQYEINVIPHAHRLPKAFIHNDANEWNILTNGQKIFGLIDFGDACYSWTINDLAVGLAYILMQRSDPVSVACEVIEAYHKVRPLDLLEMDVLYYLIAGRLCLSLCNSAKALKEHPDSEYIGISAKPAKSLLYHWLSLNPIEVTEAFKSAAGLSKTNHIVETDVMIHRDRHFSKALSLSYQQPITMAKSAFQYMYAADGTTYLDAYNNIMLVGHSHPYLTEMGSLALKQLNTNTRYHFKNLYAYSERLLGYFPKSLSKIFLVNSGSAATDLALRMARHYTGQKHIASLEYGYHGNTASGIAVSHYKHRPGFTYPDTLILPLPNAALLRKDQQTNAGEIFGQIGAARLTESEHPIAGFIAEPIVGCGGQVPLPKGYLKIIYNQIRQLGGVCISDEVQVGFGRLGSHFWGFEMHNVIPDIVILGKPIGNGHPIGAVICTDEIAASFAEGPEFFSSFGGNPVSCAIGEAVLEIIEREGLQTHAQNTGSYFKEQLKNLQHIFPHISDIRGCGMFLGVEFSTASKEPATKWAQWFKNGLRDNNILSGTDGPFDNVLKIKPPLPFDASNVDEFTGKLHDLLKAVPYC